MAHTRKFKDTIQRRVCTDRTFPNALFYEGIERILNADVEFRKGVLRDYIKAAGGFERLGTETGTSAKSPIWMLGPRGNPQARNLFSVISFLQRQAGLTLQVTAQPH